MNIYAPDKDAEQILFYRKIREYLQYRNRTDYLFVGGEFNVVQCQSKDKLFRINVQTKSSRVLNEILTDNNLIGIWRERNPNTRKYTWSKKKPKIRCRLDYFLIENKHKETVKSCSIIPSVSADHEIIEIKLNIEKIKIGRGLWKLNNRLLENEDYKLDIQNLISNVWEETQDISDTRIRFDYLKHKIIILSRKYSKTLAEKLRTKRI